MLALTLVERCDQRLNDTRGAVVTPCITPRFQIMGCIDVPLANSSCLVEVKAMIDRGGHALYGIGEVKIRRSVVRRIAAENCEHIYVTGFHFSDQFFD